MHACKTLSVILFLIWILLSSGEAAQHPHKKVLILGAGLSGIIAGKTLMDNGVDDFFILEGQNYIGGRVKQVQPLEHAIDVRPHGALFQGASTFKGLKNMPRHSKYFSRSRFKCTHFFTTKGYFLEMSLLSLHPIETLFEQLYWTSWVVL